MSLNVITVTLNMGTCSFGLVLKTGYAVIFFLQIICGFSLTALVSTKYSSASQPGGVGTPKGECK